MADHMHRLDLEMVARGLAASRAKAQAMITEGRVQVNGEVTLKTAKKVSSEILINVDYHAVEWVGRGAYKLIAALDHFGFDPKGRIAADVGASTGGFSEVLLSRGAKKIYAIDVGHDQLHARLRTQEKLVNLEGVNARYVTRLEIPDPLDMVVTDVSFISLKKVLPATLSLCTPGSVLAALVKPQFEVGKGNLGKGGIVRDPELVQQVRRDMEQWISSLPGWRSLGSIESPITGSDGNTEFLMGAHLDA